MAEDLASLHGPVGLQWTDLEADGLDDLYSLMTAIWYFEEPTERYSPEELRELVEGIDHTQGRRIVVGRKGDSTVAWAMNWAQSDDVAPRRMRLSGGVHPAFRHRGIGRRMLAWQVEWARHWYVASHRPGHGDLLVLSNIEERQANQSELVEAAGFAPLRWYLDMHCSLADLDEPLSRLSEYEERLARDGLRVLPFDPMFTESTRQAHNEAFSDYYGTQPIGPEMWAEQMANVVARPQWSWLAVDNADQVVGYALNVAYTATWEGDFTEGWTDRLGVRKGWRGRGIARALLLRSLQTFRSEGLAGGGLGVDSESGTGAVELYRSIGYQSTDTIVMYGLTETHDAALRAMETGGKVTFSG